MQQISPEVEQAMQELLKPVLQRVDDLKQKDEQNELQIKQLLEEMNQLKTLVSSLKPIKQEEEKSNYINNKFRVRKTRLEEREQCW